MNYYDLEKLWGKNLTVIANKAGTSRQRVAYWKVHGLSHNSQCMLEVASEGALRANRKPANAPCPACGKPMARQLQSFCHRCTDIYTSIKGYCHQQVAQAIKNGTLPSPKKLKCVDCGKKAACYDHRDYTQPLKVDPVCLSCDKQRGTPKKSAAQMRRAIARRK